MSQHSETTQEVTLTTRRNYRMLIGLEAQGHNQLAICGEHRRTSLARSVRVDEHLGDVFVRQGLNYKNSYIYEMWSPGPFQLSGCKAGPQNKLES